MDNCTAHPELIAPNMKTLFLPPNTVIAGPTYGTRCNKQFKV